jgi:imidazoleglycerol-phosphate dehydratase
MTEPQQARTAEIIRHTTETRIDLHLTIEGRGQYKVSTGIRFFDHMLELFTRHGGFDLELTCRVWISNTRWRMWASRWARVLRGP